MWDVVDEIWAQASAETPDIDFQAIALSSRALRLSRILDQGTRQSLAPFDAEPWELDVLGALMRVGAPYQLTAGALLRSLMVSFPALTNRVDRLVGKGLVTRDVDPDNRRQVLIALTDQGRRLVVALTPAVVERQRQLTSALSDRERADLNALLRKLLVSLGDTPDAKGIAKRQDKPPAA